MPAGDFWAIPPLQDSAFPHRTAGASQQYLCIFSSSQVFFSPALVQNVVWELPLSPLFFTAEWLRTNLVLSLLELYIQSDDWVSFFCSVLQGVNRRPIQPRNSHLPVLGLDGCFLRLGKTKYLLDWSSIFLIFPLLFSNACDCFILGGEFFSFINQSLYISSCSYWALF